MQYIKQEFNIKDLEHFSGIKAHTIRIWEKRYNLLKPQRTHTNIRVYDTEALQKLLNISFLSQNGEKISKIGQLTEQQLEQRVQTIAKVKTKHQHTLFQLKLATINFDQAHFSRIYDKLSKNKSFDEIFDTVLIPFLHELGLLWQTKSINPAQEHFVSHLIQQKLYLNIEAQQTENVRKPNKVFVLFLPENEIHDLGLLYVNYILLKRGYRSIYLGQSVPLSNLTYLSKTYENLHFLSYLTIKPTHLKKYLQEFDEKVSAKISCKYWILGPKIRQHENLKKPENITFFQTIGKIKTHL